MSAALDIGECTFGDLGIRRVMIGRLRGVRGLPVVVGRAELDDGRVVCVEVPGSAAPVADVVRALHLASMRGDA